MKLLKINSLAVIILLSSHTSNAQIYINAGIGYGAPVFKNLLSADYTTTPTSGTYTGQYSSLGRGFQPQLVIGYKINPTAGIELGYGYLIGSKVVKDIEDGSDPDAVEKGTGELWARMSRISLGLRFTQAEGNLNPYMRLGMVLGVGAKVTSETNTTITGPGLNSTFSRKEEFTGGIAVGLSGALGVNYHVSETFGIFFEAGLTAQQYAPQRGLITVYKVDGQDQLGSMNVRQKETEFSEEFTESNPPNDNAPANELKYYWPMSSIDIAVGVHFFFGGE